MSKDTQYRYKLNSIALGNEKTIYTFRIVLNALRQFGIDPIAFIQALKALPRFLKEVIQFRAKVKSSAMRLAPALQDYHAQAGSADGHYFWQDLLCAQWIHEEKPKEHFDVGSRIDGFIAHLLSFREVTQLDIRPSALKISGLKVVVGDAQENLTEFQNAFDSVSSLHSIEHFGLGRYSDKLDMLGHEKGLENISKCVAVNGYLYVSFPIGKEKVEFNSQRIINPSWPVKLLKDFELKSFILIPWRGKPIMDVDPHEVDQTQTGQAGLYKFLRIK